MENIINALGQIDGLVSAIIASVGTFFITKYTYHKNIPLDKLEISYNRIYYPIYCLLRNNKDVLHIVEKSEEYLQKYNKYVDKSTSLAFDFLKRNIEDKDAYNTYKSNIFEMNRKLRRRLGYLEPDAWTIYTYSSLRERFVLRAVCELLSVYVFITMGVAISHELIRTVLLALSIIGVLILIVDIIGSLCGIIWKIVMKKIKSKQKKK